MKELIKFVLEQLEFRLEEDNYQDVDREDNAVMVLWQLRLALEQCAVDLVKVLHEGLTELIHLFEEETDDYETDNSFGEYRDSDSIHDDITQTIGSLLQALDPPAPQTCPAAEAELGLLARAKEAEQEEVQAELELLAVSLAQPVQEETITAVKSLEAELELLAMETEIQQAKEWITKIKQGEDVSDFGVYPV